MWSAYVIPLSIMTVICTHHTHIDPNTSPLITLQSYDIAFSVDLNDETKVSYTRYASHYKPVCGVMLVDDVDSRPVSPAISPTKTPTKTAGQADGEHAYGDTTPNAAGRERSLYLTSPLTSPVHGAISSKLSDGEELSVGSLTRSPRNNARRRSFNSVDASDKASVVTLKFDNTYAKLHTKKLSWSARVVEVEEYHAAKEKAMEVQKEKKLFEMQRHRLRKLAIRVAANRSGVIHVSSIEADYLEEETEGKIELLQEKESLEAENAELKTKLSNLTAERDGFRRQAEDVGASWRFSMQQVEDLTKKAAVMQETFNQQSEKILQHEQALKEATELQLQTEQRLAKSSIAAQNDLSRQLLEKEKELNEITAATEVALQQADDTITTLEQQLEQARIDLQAERDRSDKIPIPIQDDSGIKNSIKSSSGSDTAIVDIDKRMEEMAGKLKNHTKMN